MKTPKNFIMTFLLTMSSMTAFAQSVDSKSIQKRVEKINLSSNGDKALYLENFLDNMKVYPAKFADASGSLRDSVRNDIQIEYNSILLAVFNKNSEKGAAEIKKSMSKAFGDSFRLLNGDQLTKERQDRLDKLVMNTKDLIRKYNFLSGDK